MSPKSCTDEVFKGIPNLKRLGIQIELAHGGSNPLHCFDCISNLNRLESFECVVVNPEFGVEFVATPIPMFPLVLRKLSLSGLGYSWENMISTIGELRKLEVLKLRCFAFQGTMWAAEAYSLLLFFFLIMYCFA